MSTTCKKLEEQFQALYNQIGPIQSKLTELEARNPTTVDEAKALQTEIARVLGRGQTPAPPGTYRYVRASIILLNDEASKLNCKQLRENINKAIVLLTSIDLSALRKIDDLAAKINTLQKQEDETQKATTTQNNQGTGASGTAGTGPGATPNSDQLKEIDIQAKKSPEEVTVTGTRRAEDGLDGVEVTGKRSPTLISGDPAIPDQVDVDVQEPPEIAIEQNTNAGVTKARSMAALKDTTNFEAKKDWRVRLSLSPGANYLYKSNEPGILGPLQVTDGVIFPYTPTITINYNAQYTQEQLTHTNYRFAQYVGSNVDNINITCDFTAQDVFEANYLLATIHFFRTVTKMFYGQDENPKPGTPPPLCYLFGLGEFQFNAHPLAINNFTYTLPNNVDYIRAGTIVSSPGENRNSPPLKAPEKPKDNIFGAIKGAVSQSRLVQGIAKIGNSVGLEIVPGGGLSSPSFQNNTGFNSLIPPGTNEPTYVPTNIQLSINCIPIVSRYDVSNTFSLKEYASGKLLQGIKRSGGGFW